jgi:hypothetical protein
MKRNALTTIVAILLLLYSFANFGAALAQFTKGKAVSGTTSFAASLGQMAGDQAGADRVKRKGAATSAVLYAIAIFILATAVLDLTSAVGLLGGQKWALTVVAIAALCGFGVEIQDTLEDGFGIGKMIFFIINGLALMMVFEIKKAQQASESEGTLESA